MTNKLDAPIQFRSFEAVIANKEALRNQINRIKETINKVLREDSTLGERLRSLLREQGFNNNKCFYCYWYECWCYC